ncbi:hypothetical protein EC973_004216 [Apophysomyces ossiformis]|uniref:Alpha/beta hydrolase fold-3 domain-containing protein n=1 Tax=Apophysomyces ossiformis TaxID=679940 RepID=A0A8H7BWZ4_9FUNG|nr:hypothetical protein EC973_004216 [Apophysomyces ossiformis]
MSIFIHPAYQAFLKQFRSGPDTKGFTAQQLREHINGLADTSNLPDIYEEEYNIVAGPNKAELVLTVIRPIGTEKDILPVTLYLHGGGWILGDRATYERTIRNWAIQTHGAVAFVEYSLSPEIKFPVAQEECYDTLLWILKNHQQIRVNPDKLVIGGDSAGGNLSAVVCLMAKDRGFVDKIKAQVLIYPAVTEDREEFESYRTCGGGDYVLSTPEVIWSYEQAFGEDAHNNKYAMPLTASLDELRGLPPALVLTAEADLLRDEGEAYAVKLTKAGVEAVAVRVLNAVHGIFSLVYEAPQYDFSMGIITSYVNKVYQQ